MRLSRSYLPHLFLAVFSVLVLFAALLWSRFGDVYDASNVFTPCIHVPSSREHWGVPNCHGLSRLGKLTAEMSFNAAGIRDRDYPPRAEKGVFRILVVGSSNALGPGVEEKKTFPRQLEAELRRAGRKVEVINGAMIGYCTLQTSMRLKELLEAYSPQLVLYQFVQGACPLLDGAWRERLKFEGLDPVSIDRGIFDHSRSLSGLNRFFFDHQSIYFLALTLTDQWRKIAFSRYYSADKNRSLELYLSPTLELLQYMKEKSAAKGAQFRIVSYRMKSFMQAIPSHYHLWLARPLSGLVKPIEFTHEQMFDRMRAAGFGIIYPPFETPPVLVPGDSHLSEEGLAMLAKATASEVLPLLPHRRGAK